MAVMKNCVHSAAALATCESSLGAECSMVAGMPDTSSRCRA